MVKAVSLQRELMHQLGQNPSPRLPRSCFLACLHGPSRRCWAQLACWACWGAEAPSQPQQGKAGRHVARCHAHPCHPCHPYLCACSCHPKHPCHPLQWRRPSLLCRRQQHCHHHPCTSSAPAPNNCQRCWLSFPLHPHQQLCISTRCSCLTNSRNSSTRCTCTCTCHPCSAGSAPGNTTADDGGGGGGGGGGGYDGAWRGGGG